MLISSAWTSKDQNPSNPYFPNLKIWKFSLDGNERVQLTNKSGNYADFCPCWSPNGEKVAFIRSRMAKGSFFLNYDEAGIYIIDSSGNESQILQYSDDKFFFSLSWSPDGKMLAYFTKEKEAPNKCYMNVIHLETGKTRVIREFTSVNAVNEAVELAWSPDSRRIAFNGEEIQVVNIDDGSIETIESNLLDVIKFHIDWSPDGKYFVFGGLIMPKSEFWFLEDFLPLSENKN
jgi:Tol biopolymer transport system component